MKKRTIAVVVFAALLLTACNFPLVRDTEEELADAVAKTVEALEAEAVQPELIIPTVEPLLPTATPRPTVAVKPTPTTVPCLFAAFVTETVKDSTRFSPGESFTKSWTLRNAGSCTWTTGYRIIFRSGNQMGGPDKQNLPTAVRPGETVKIDVDLTAPAAAGTYRGTWILRTDRGVDFGLPHGVWVQITVN